GELGALDVHVHGVAVEARLDHRAIERRSGPRCRRGAGLRVAARGLRELDARAAPGERVLERFAEIDVARLVARGIGVRDVRRQQLLPERAYVERLGVKAQ